MLLTVVSTFIFPHGEKKFKAPFLFELEEKRVWRGYCNILLAYFLTDIMSDCNVDCRSNLYFFMEVYTLNIVEVQNIKR